MNYNSTKNQEIKGNLVSKHVYANVNTMVDELIKANSLDHELGFDTWEYLTPYVNYEGEEITQEEIDEKIERIEAIISEYEFEGDEDTPSYASIEKRIEKLEETLDELKSLDCDEYPEIYEYWLVSDWFAGKLKDQGQIIIDVYNQPIWGRQTTGQAILLDHCISMVAEDMEILEGQQNEW